MGLFRKNSFLIPLWAIILLLAILQLININFSHILGSVISSKLGVPVQIEKLHWNLEKITLHNLKVKNPKKSHLPYALMVEEVTLHTPLHNYFDDPIYLDTLLLDHIHVSIEFFNQDRSEGNWHTIFANLQNGNDDHKKNGKSWVIKNLNLYDIHVELLNVGGKVQTLSPIAQLEFHNLNTEKGIPTEEITQIVVNHMMNSIFLVKGLKTIFTLPKNILETLFDPTRVFNSSMNKQEKDDIYGDS